MFSEMFLSKCTLSVFSLKLETNVAFAFERIFGKFAFVLSDCNKVAVCRGKSNAPHYPPPPNFLFV
jgi:hypothetical protein